MAFASGRAVGECHADPCRNMAFRGSSKIPLHQRGNIEIMNTDQDKRAQMHAKLREGLQILSEASNEDQYKLNAALIKLHSALEDFVRIGVAQKAPYLREAVEDVRQTTWNDLIAYGKQYLGFSERDARIISVANRQRQDVAHGNNYSGSRDELAEYGAFVERWCNSGKAIAENSRPQPSVESSDASQLSALPRSAYSPDSHKPWYRSTVFLVLTFFLLPPVWALLIITDRSQSGPVTIFAYTVLLVIFLCGIGVVSSSVFMADTFSEIFSQIGLPIVSTRIPQTTASPPINDVPAVIPTATPIPPTSVASTDVTCTIVWVEHPQDNLARKSRSKVWEEIVKFKVDGSGMTPREFYDLVAEHNPELAADGYEFKKGKTYLLPECQ